MKTIADGGPTPFRRIADSDALVAEPPPSSHTPSQPHSANTPAFTPTNPQSAIRNPQSITLHIEELVLHGFAPGDRYRIAEAVERELTRLLAQQGLPPLLVQRGEVEHINAGSFQVGPEARSELTGQQVARAVYRGLRR